MGESQAGHNASQVTLSLQVASSLARVLDTGDPLNEAVREAIARGLADVLKTLGIPGNPAVEIAALEGNTTLAGRFMCVVVNDQLCLYPDELLQRVHSYVSGVPLGSRTKPAQILAWLSELSDSQAAMAEDNLVDFLSLACLEVVKRRPAVLLGPAQAAAYQAALPAPAESDLSGTWPPDQTWLLPVLAEVLDLRISIADKQAVAEVLSQGLAQDRSQEDVVEDLVAALRPDIVEIQLRQEYLRQMTTGESENDHGYFAMMRDGLFYELGLRYPNFRFAPVEYLKPNGFAFKINHLTTLPRVGLQPDQCLVNETPSRLRLLNIPAEDAVNPANANECSFINVKSKPDAEAAGLTTWNRMGYLVLCFSADLRENSVCFLDHQVVQDHLEQLEQAFPALVKAAQAKVSVEQITRVLRALVSEEISIRNLRLILEGILDYDYIVTDPSQYIIFDDRLPIRGRPDQAWLGDPVNLASFIRTGMKRYISHKYTRGQNTLIVYLLDPEIEKILSERQALEIDEKTSLLEAVRAEVNVLPPTSMAPTILTSIEVRPSLREIIASEFPRLPVLSYQELSPDTNIQPIARIVLNT